MSREIKEPTTWLPALIVEAGAVPTTTRGIGTSATGATGRVKWIETSFGHKKAREAQMISSVFALFVPLCGYVFFAAWTFVP